MSSVSLKYFQKLSQSFTVKDGGQTKITHLQNNLEKTKTTQVEEKLKLCRLHTQKQEQVVKKKKKGMVTGQKYPMNFIQEKAEMTIPQNIKVKEFSKTQYEKKKKQKMGGEKSEKIRKFIQRGSI